jgi:hypothetical protein
MPQRWEVSTMSQRPLGVTVLAVLAVLEGLLAFVAAMALMFAGVLGSAGGASNGGTAVVVGAAMFALSMVSLGLGLGFWLQKAWAWGAAFMVFAVVVVLNLATVMFLGASLFSIVVPVAVAAGVMWYLTQPATKAALGHGAEGAAQA